MKKFILPVVCLLMFSACNQKSEKEIRNEIELEYAQKELAETKEKLAEMEKSKEATQEKKGEKKESKPVSASSVAPLHKGSSGDVAWGTDFDWLSQRYVNDGDLAYCDGSWLRILRNSIYARHGYKFKSADLHKYFSQFSWYHPRYSDVESKLSTIEKANIKEIKNWE